VHGRGFIDAGRHIMSDDIMTRISDDIMALDRSETRSLSPRLSPARSDEGRYPPSSEFRTLKAILAKLRPERVREPLPARKVYAPPRSHRH
jgi:hypothetical protein